MDSTTTTPISLPDIEKAALKARVALEILNDLLTSSKNSCIPPSYDELRSVVRAGLRP